MSGCGSQLLKMQDLRRTLRDEEAQREGKGRGGVRDGRITTRRRPPGSYLTGWLRWLTGWLSRATYPPVGPLPKEEKRGTEVKIERKKERKQETQAVTSVTEEALNQLQTCLEAMPDANTELTDPEGLRVPLMPHQRQALAWLTWRESQDPPGGILADDMGLGKTLTMIALTLKSKEAKTSEMEKPDAVGKEEGVDVKEGGGSRGWRSKACGGDFISSCGTLVVCPASVIHQWDKEVERRCCRKLNLKTLVYHGPTREKSARKIAAYDFVFTTYTIMSSEGKLPGDEVKKAWHAPAAANSPAADAADAGAFAHSPLFRIGWERVVLDEAHTIKNHKSQTAVSSCRLRAKCRWAVTGTPIQNQLLDMYSLLRFLRVSPFDEFKLWKAQVERAKFGTKRLHALIRSLLLRRTKSEVDGDGKPLVNLPEKNTQTHLINLNEDEQRIYNKVFAQSKEVFVRFLERHESPDSRSTGTSSGNAAGSGRDGAAGPRPTQAHILVLLLRLRQACSHLSLLQKSIDTKEDKDAAAEEGIELHLAEMMTGMNLAVMPAECHAPGGHAQGGHAQGGHAPSPQSEETSKHLKIQGEQDLALFRPDFSGTKLDAVKNHLASIAGGGEKTVLVSQWTSMLAIVAHHLDKMKMPFFQIKGDVCPRRRTEIVEDFNASPSSPRVLLLSLRAGGVGLNLVGANHLFLLDMHWNPALEAQAIDRIYRVGQTRDVHIHKFVCQGTIEERIRDLQQTKTSLADNVLHGQCADAGNDAASNSKLTLQDLKLLFGISKPPPPSVHTEKSTASFVTSVSSVAETALSAIWPF